MDELNRKLAEWAGFTSESRTPNSMWLWTDGDYHNCIPNFTESLDACFKWLVPELLLDKKVTITIWNGEKLWYVQLSRPHKFFIVGQAETLALALCLVIEKLIDGEKNG